MRTNTTHDAGTGAAGVRGGYRGTTGKARYTAQLVALVTIPMRNRVRAMADKHGVSQSKIMRAIFDSGIEAVEAGLASGTIRPDTLA